MRRQLTMDNNK